MGTKNYTSIFNEKVVKSVSSAKINKDIVNNTDTIVLFNIPESSIVTDIRVVIEKAVTTATAKVSAKLGTEDVLSAKDLNGALGTVTAVALNKYTGAGKTFSISHTAAIADLEYTIVVEYLEYTLRKGTTTYIG